MKMILAKDLLVETQKSELKNLCARIKEESAKGNVALYLEGGFFSINIKFLERLGYKCSTGSVDHEFFVRLRVSWNGK